jgi:isopentenyldiphosphate isomerase
MEETLETRDKQGNKVILSRDEIIDQHLIHKAGLVIIKDKTGRFLISQRSEKKKVYPLLWCFGAGGGVRADESFEEGAKRELKEELGISPPIKFLCDWEYNSKEIQYIAKVYIAEYKGKITIDPEEIIQTLWVTKEELNKFIEEKLLSPDNIIFYQKHLKI